MWIVHWGLLLRLPWRTWICPCEGQLWRWSSCLGHRGSGITRYSGELAVRAAGKMIWQTVLANMHQVFFSREPPPWPRSIMVFIDQDLGTGVKKKKDAGDPSLKWNKGTLFAATHTYVSSIKWLFSHLKEWHSTSCNKVDSPLSKRLLKRVTEGNSSRCSFPWSQYWELWAALLIPIFQELIRNRESLRNGTQRKKPYWIP